MVQPLVPRRAEARVGRAAGARMSPLAGSRLIVTIRPAAGRRRRASPPRDGRSTFAPGTRGRTRSCRRRVGLHARTDALPRFGWPSDPPAADRQRRDAAGGARTTRRRASCPSTARSCGEPSPARRCTGAARRRRVRDARGVPGFSAEADRRGPAELVDRAVARVRDVDVRAVGRDRDRRRDCSVRGRRQRQRRAAGHRRRAAALLKRELAARRRCGGRPRATDDDVVTYTFAPSGETAMSVGVPTGADRACTAPTSRSSRSPCEQAARHHC